jgi:hypothetical protein
MAYRDEIEDALKDRTEDIESALKNRTELNDIKIKEDVFVYAMVEEDTGMKFELPTEDEYKVYSSDVAYLVWEENDHVDQNEVKNDLDTIVDKANEVYNNLS